MKPDATIFVSIASYRDAELLPTLENMLAEAHHSERLHITICWQDDMNIQPFLDLGMVLETSQNHENYSLHRFRWQKSLIQIVAVHYFAAKGACWARYMAEQHYQDENYFLQIDSHCRFIHHWDSEMIAILESLRPQSLRPVLSTYPPGYVPGEDEDRKSYVSRLIFKDYSDGGIPGFTSREMRCEAPRRCSFLAGGFIFSDGHFVKNVPNDPQIFFLGEEIAMAVRAFTHGYDFWTPHRILLWHYYGRSGQPKVWSDHNGKAKQSGAVEQTWWERDKISKLRVSNILGMTDEYCDLGEYQLGTQRSLQEYSWRSGLAFKEQKAHPDALAPINETFFNERPSNEQQWLKSLRFVKEKKILLSKELIDFSQNGVLWWHVGVYNSHNTSIIVKNLTTAEIEKQLQVIDDQTNELAIDYKHLDESQSYVVRICPWLEEECWGKIVEVAW